MKAGPKSAVNLDPLPDRIEDPAAWIERYCVTPRGHGALAPLRLAPFQREILGGIYAPGRRQAVVTCGRGNGKSTLLAAVALFEAFAGQWSAEVCIVAPTERQARHLLDQARRMVDLNPELSERCQTFQKMLRVPGRDAEVLALPSTAERLQGLDPTLAVIDELADVLPATYEALDLALGKRPESRMVAISTPGGDREGPLWRLVEHGRAHPEDPRLWFREWSAPTGCDLDDEAAWRAANPAIEAGFLDAEAIRANLVTSREESFRTYRLAQWTAESGRWLRWGQWAACEAVPPRALAPGEPVVLAFDGSASGDSTALVAATLDPAPFVAVVGCWENPGDPRWRVPRADVLATVAEIFDRYDVVEMAADPWGWRTELEALAAAYPGRVAQWPTNVVSRIAPATDRTYSLIAEGHLRHDGDARLAAHVAHVVAKRTAAGDVPTKEAKTSARKIDLAVAMILGVDRAAWHREHAPRSRRAVAFF